MAFSIKTLLKGQSTVFSFKEIAIVSKDESQASLVSKLHYYVKKGDLYSPHRGFYAKDKNYNRLELANKIYSPSYVSFETVLTNAGIIFQYYSQICIASYLSREINIDNQIFSYKKLKSEILNNQCGVTQHEGYWIATPERALLDTLYLNKKFHFDNLSIIDWRKVNDLIEIYNCKWLAKKVQDIENAREPKNKTIF